MRKVNGIVLSNDGERAVVRMSNGDRVTFLRKDPQVEKVPTRKEFLSTLKPGEVSPSFERTKL